MPLSWPRRFAGDTGIIPNLFTMHGALRVRLLYQATWLCPRRPPAAKVPNRGDILLSLPQVIAVSAPRSLQKQVGSVQPNVTAVRCGGTGPDLGQMDPSV